MPSAACCRCSRSWSAPGVSPRTRSRRSRASAAPPPNLALDFLGPYGPHNFSRRYVRALQALLEGEQRYGAANHVAARGDLTSEARGFRFLGELYEQQ